MIHRLVLRSTPLAVAVASLALTAAVPPAATAYTGSSSRYLSGATVVARGQRGLVQEVLGIDAGPLADVDSGAVVCNPAEGMGVGGTCLPFGGGDAVKVVDDVMGEEVAFQVCLDNDGNGFCLFPDPDPVCADVVLFSHGDDGAFYNPVGPLPTSFTPGCPGGRWDGYVVYLCEGAHVQGGGHAHAAVEGTATVTGGGEGAGSFCGNPFGKPYFVNSGNETCGLNAAGTAPQGGMSGTVTGGPWREFDSAGGTVEHLAMACTVQNDATPGDGVLARRVLHASGAGAHLGQLTEAIEYFAPGGREVFLCTAVSWAGSNGSGSFEYDADPVAPGVQCPRAVTAYVDNGTARARATDTVAPSSV